MSKVAELYAPVHPEDHGWDGVPPFEPNEPWENEVHQQQQQPTQNQQPKKESKK